jgi:hypothetical protein
MVTTAEQECQPFVILMPRRRTMSQRSDALNKLEYTAYMSAEPSGPWANAWCDNRKEYNQARQVRAEQRAARMNGPQTDTTFSGSRTDYANA